MKLQDIFLNQIVANHMIIVIHFIEHMPTCYKVHHPNDEMFPSFCGSEIHLYVEQFKEMMETLLFFAGSQFFFALSSCSNWVRLHAHEYPGFVSVFVSEHFHRTWETWLTHLPAYMTQYSNSIQVSGFFYSTSQPFISGLGVVYMPKYPSFYWSILLEHIQVFQKPR